MSQSIKAVFSACLFHLFIAVKSGSRESLLEDEVISNIRLS